MKETKTQPETKVFETEISELLNLITHSLYSHKEIFIRELVSNASDAIDKVRFISLTEKDILGSDSKFEIKILLDEKNQTFSITDNGIGMNKDELVKNIGTIARSGSKEFLKTVDKSKENALSLIGQFGVGFYSIFMVADKVTLKTLRAGDSQGYKWESDGKGSYTIEEIDKKTRGTEIILHMNDEGKEYLEDWNVRSVIRKFSDFVSYDILMPKIDTRSEKEKEDDVKEGKIFKSELEVINSGKALWTRPKNEITDEMYNEFYKHISHDFEEPLSKIHFKQEGITSYSAIAYVPAKAPFDLFTNPEPKGLSLYVNKVFIMDNCKDLLPNYLRFMKGIIDSEDLPLNVSRELLQQNPHVAKIKQTLTKKILSLFQEISTKESEKYLKFYKEMGIVLKEGVYFDHENQEKIASLLRYNSSMQDADNLVSLKDYISRMKENQKDIYFITSETIEQAKASPHLEIFKRKEIEVLFMTDPVDEWVVSSLPEFEGKKLTSIAKGELDLGDLGKEEQKEAKKAEKELKKLSELFRSSFQESIKEVRITTRLTDSPCCIVADSNDMSANMEKILKMTNKGGSFSSKKILEINPNHPVIINLNKLAEKNEKSEETEDWINVLYDQALLAEGSKIVNPKKFNERLNKLMLKASQGM